MSNVVEINGPNPEQITIDNLVSQISVIKQQIEQDKQKIFDDEKLDRKSTR